MFLTQCQVLLVACSRSYHPTCCLSEKRPYFVNSSRFHLHTFCWRKRSTGYKAFAVWVSSKDRENPSSLNGTKDLANDSQLPVKKPTLLDSAVESSRQQKSRLESLSNSYLNTGESLEEEEEEEPTSIRQFMGELWEELKQVEWPTLKQALQELVILSLGISVVAGFIYLVDALFSYIAAILYLK
ncbi:hypothetical protein Gasu2_08360 [Galdieria sulphuraria]|uniref:Preprotein translocase subunit SecE n=1 Tax=Galdieria sulphuraria TaxID=130081 RepID=M2XV45_GALSU|nr:uncharacterized protein Gasu_49710 [Galdieria sulphuraria]EME27523.1 hypothetical protein Gasu_49710 [Galdieria sulphuraria]GJD06417.1 hypothetical protein Gasu2_08360 [Galdieria sulphuraria]|eukprot:XP_005704043.1 hypothetical protein Gasu_49710 [Galdieria sulphuraria]